MSTTGTRIHHVTKPGTNLFPEPGFSREEAKRLQVASPRPFGDARRLEEPLMDALAAWSAARHLPQADADENLMISRPRVSDVVDRKSSGFRIDALVELLGRIGKPVRIAVG